MVLIGYFEKLSSFCCCYCLRVLLVTYLSLAPLLRSLSYKMKERDMSFCVTYQFDWLEQFLHLLVFLGGYSVVDSVHNKILILLPLLFILLKLLKRFFSIKILSEYTGRRERGRTYDLTLLKPNSLGNFLETFGFILLKVVRISSSFSCCC